MLVRRATTWLTIATLALALFGCGVAEDYEAAAVLQVTKNEGTVVSVSGTVDPLTNAVTVTGVEDNQIEITVHNYPRAGAGQAVDVLITGLDVALFDSHPAGRRAVLTGTIPWSGIVKANSDTIITWFGTIPAGEIMKIADLWVNPTDPDEAAAVSNYVAEITIHANEVSVSGDMGEPLSTNVRSFLLVDPTGIQ